MKISKYLGLALLSAAAGTANAASVFSDGFEASVSGLLTAPSNWSVSNGTVDVIGAGSDYGLGLAETHGKFIDLDGSTNAAGTLSYQLSLTAGDYLLSFDLAGSQRPGYGNDIVDVRFGDSTASFTKASDDAFQKHTLAFTVASSGSYSFSFANQGGDNVGALLDNVNVSAVPEPESYALMLAGLGALALARRRSRQG